MALAGAHSRLTAIAVGVATVAIAMLAAPAAWGATTLGQAAAPGVTNTCGGATTFIQNAVAGSPSYTVPAGGGVITSWSTMANSQADKKMGLQVVRAQSATAFVTMARDLEHTLTPSQLNTFKVRIPVLGSEILAAFYSTSGTSCQYPTVAGDTTRYESGTHPEPPIGTTLATNTQDGSFRVNISAVLEPDADGDGFGDDTQDLCPTNGSTALACPVVIQPDKSAPTGSLFVLQGGTLAKALKSGITTIVGISEAGKISATASGTLPKKARKKRRKKASSSAVLATGSATAAKPGAVEVRLRFTSTAKQRLRKARKLRLSLSYTLTDSANNGTKLPNKSLTLRGSKRR
jgi:hypothetical protein